MAWRTRVPWARRKREASMTIPVLAMCGFALLAALHGTDDAHYVWRPPPPATEIVCIDIGAPHPLCYTINR